MGLWISVLATVAIFLSSPAAAQVKSWVDKSGIVHYEGTGPNQPESASPPQLKPNTRHPIERNHANLTLGDDESSFIASHKGVYLGKSGSEGNYYRYSGSLPKGAINMGLFFVTGRLAFVSVEYHDLGAGGWEQLVKQTSDKYGPPLGDTQSAIWNDGTTTLTLKHESNGDITILLEDFAAMSKYSEEQKASLPKF